MEPSASCPLHIPFCFFFAPFYEINILENISEYLAKYEDNIFHSV